MSDESELEKYARRKNAEARQHAIDVENSDYFWGNCIKFVVGAILLVVGGTILVMCVGSAATGISEGYFKRSPKAVVKPKTPVCDSNFLIPIENRKIETTPVKDKDILGMWKMPNKEGVVTGEGIICYNENGTYQMFANGDLLRYGSYEIINGNQIQFTIYGEEGVAKVNGEWKVVTPSPDTTVLWTFAISGDVITLTHEGKSSKQYRAK